MPGTPDLFTKGYSGTSNSGQVWRQNTNDHCLEVAVVLRFLYNFMVIFLKDVLVSNLTKLLCIRDGVVRRLL